MNSRPARQCIADAVVESNASVCQGHWRFVLRADRFPECLPGKFINILCHDRATEDGTPEGPARVSGPFLRRPFSVAELRRHGQTTWMDIIHHVIGAGTAWRAAPPPGGPG